MNFVIYPYKMGSSGAKSLAKALGCKRVYPHNQYRYKDGDIVINWGSSELPTWYKEEIPRKAFVNMPDSVALAANKSLALKVLKIHGVSIPKFTDNINAAREMLEDDERVYCRTKLTGHSGDGIIVARCQEDLVEAPLYVEGIRGLRDEFRVHVFEGEVIDIQMKKKKIGAEYNVMVRNHQNGYIYCRNDIETSDDMRKLALDAVDALSLDFGAVDIIKLRNNNDMYVLEVNCAPGLEGTTLEKYTQAIISIKEN